MLKQINNQSDYIKENPDTLINIENIENASNTNFHLWQYFYKMKEIVTETVQIVSLLNLKS
jgi:hypothetical protein